MGCGSTQSHGGGRWSRPRRSWGANTGSPRELVFESREELLYLLGEATELEHSIDCAYLYAAFTLQAEPGAGLTAAQVPTVAGWKRAINQIAL